MGTKGQVAPKNLYAMRYVQFFRSQETRSCGTYYFMASSRLRQIVFVSGPYGASGLVGADDERNVSLHSLIDGQHISTAEICVGAPVRLQMSDEFAINIQVSQNIPKRSNEAYKALENGSLRTTAFFHQVITDGVLDD